MMMNLEEETFMINISGHRFETMRKTLEKYPETLLGSNKREEFFNYRTNEYFFDRDPDIFRHILNYYRTGKLHFPSDECVTSYVEELEFFNVRSDVIAVCCNQGFLNKKVENDELIQSMNIIENSDEEIPSLRNRLWKALEDPHSSTGAMILYCVIAFFIVLLSIAVIIKSVPCGVRPGRAGTLSCGERYKIIFFCLESAGIIFFTFEYFLRLFASPSRKKFIRSRMGLIDLFVFGSFYVNFFVPEVYGSSFVLLRAFRLLAIFNSSEQPTNQRILRETLKSSASDIIFLILSLLVLTLIFAGAIFSAEKHVDGTNFTSIPAAFWFVIGAMMMLGYGDMVPETIAGKIVASACSVCGLVFVAVFVSVIVANYNRNYLQKCFEKKDPMKIKSSYHSV